MLNITLRQLRLFAAVARHGSITRAAEEVHLTQPAVSMQVKQLEAVLDMPLVEQAGRRLALTEAGREVQAYARAVLGQIDELESVLDGLKGLERGRLHISAITTASYFAPRVLGAFCQRYPGISLSLDVTNRDAVLAGLEGTETDMAIMGQPPAGVDVALEAHRFLDNPLVIIAPPDHPLAGGRAITLERLGTEPFLVREAGSGTRDAMERLFAARGIDWQPGMEMGSIEAIKQSVQAGLGLALMPRDAIDMELSLGRLAILDVEGFPIRRHWHLVHRQGRRLSPLAEAFKAFVLDRAAPLLGRPRPTAG